MNLLLGLAVTLGAVASTPALADYPDQPITLLNGGNPGGGADVGIRTWQPYMERCLGTTIIVVHKPGAAGAIANSELAQSTPDGYTIGSVNLPQFVTNIISKPDVTWKVESFDFIGVAVGGSSTINVSVNSPFKTLAEFVEHVKSSDKPVNVGIGGLGADDHLAGLRLMQMIAPKFNFIPFGDGVSSRNALMGGQIDVAMMSTSEAAGFKENVRTLAVAATERSKLMPEVPTFQEQGFDLVAGSEHTVAAPAGVPDEALNKLRDCFAQATSDPGFLADAEKRSVSLRPMSAKAAEQWVKQQFQIISGLWETDPWIK